MKKTSYPVGTPCWVDLATADVPAAVAFYGGLFGWNDTVGPPETGGYVMCDIGGAAVAGIGPFMGDPQPSMWTTYLASDDLDDTAARINKAGGESLTPIMDVMNLGRMAIFTDAEGAGFGSWQKGEFVGAGLVNEPGALIWNELMTRDVDGAKEFYAAVFGVGAKSTVVDGKLEYTELLVDDKSVAGVMVMDQQFPAHIPAHWITYFAVDDVEATVARVVQLGGSVSVAPTHIPVGTFAIVIDPGGARFAVIRMA